MFLLNELFAAGNFLHERFDTRIVPAGTESNRRKC
jgi:hypothetical protein